MPTAPAATQTANATARNSRLHVPDRPRGLLEPCAATSGKHGSEEGSAGKRRSLSDYYLLEAAGLAVQLVNSAQCRQLAGRGEDGPAGRAADRPAGRDGPAAPVVRAAAGDPRVAGPDPHPAAGRRRPDRRVAAAGEAAGRRAGQAVVRGALAGPDQDRPPHPGRHRRWRDRPRVTGGRAAIARALEGMQVREHHRLLIRIHLDHITLLDRQVAALEDEITAALEQIPAAWGADAG